MAVTYCTGTYAPSAVYSLQMTDAELVNAARTGDEAAWEALVRAYQPAVFRLAYLLLGEADDADDVAQETFLRAQAALHRFDVVRPLRPWLFRIAANLARNKRRSFSRYFAALQRLLRAEPEPVINIPQASVQKQDAQALWQAVRQLGQNEQTVIYLRYFLELSEAEMAATLELPPGTVKSRLHRALRKLRQVIERDYAYLREELADG